MKKKTEKSRCHHCNDFTESDSGGDNWVVFCSKPECLDAAALFHQKNRKKLTSGKVEVVEGEIVDENDEELKRLRRQRENLISRHRILTINPERIDMEVPEYRRKKVTREAALAGLRDVRDYIANGPSDEDLIAKINALLDDSNARTKMFLAALAGKKQEDLVLITQDMDRLEEELVSRNFETLPATVLIQIYNSLSTRARASEEFLSDFANLEVPKTVTQKAQALIAENKLQKHGVVDNTATRRKVLAMLAEFRHHAAKKGIKPLASKRKGKK